MAAGRLRKFALVLVGLVVLVIGVGAWLLRVDDIPAELPPVVGDPASIVIPPVSDEPALELAKLHGKTAFFVVFSPAMRDKKEGQALNRALNRWQLPPGTEGHIVADGEGFGMFKGKVADMMRHFAAETRYPVHVDYEGVFTTTFALAKGHHGFVVIGPDGAVLERRSGGAEGADLERIREMLGATEPPAGPPMPTFSIGEVGSDTCGGGTPCVIIFLAREIAKADVPGIDGGFDGEETETFERMKDPSIRMVSTAMKAKLQKAKGAIVGRTRDLEFPTWSRVDDDADGRAAFGVGPTEAAFVVIDAEGRVVLSTRGPVALYQWGLVADTLGVELDEDDD